MSTLQLNRIENGILHRVYRRMTNEHLALDDDINIINSGHGAYEHILQ